MTGEDFQILLKRLIGADEAARCIRKICRTEHLDGLFFAKVTNAEAVALYVYATANGWHTMINSELWSGNPRSDVTLFAQILDSALAKIPAIRGSAATVYRGYSASDLAAFGNHYPLGEIVKFPAFTSASFSASGAFGGTFCSSFGRYLRGRYGHTLRTFTRKKHCCRPIAASELLRRKCAPHLMRSNW